MKIELSKDSRLNKLFIKEKTELDDIATEIKTTVYEFHEEATKEHLKKLGWIEPESAKEMIEALKFIYGRLNWENQLFSIRVVAKNKIEKVLEHYE